MLKKVILVLAAAAIMPLAALAQKIGTVDVNTIFEVMPERTVAEQELAEASKKYEEEFKKLQDELDKKYQEFQALGTDTPESIKERRMQEIQELANKTDQFRNTATQDLQRQQQQKLAPIQQKIMDAIKAVGQEGSYTMILPAEVPYYAGSDVVDVTPAVKARLGIK